MKGNVKSNKQARQVGRTGAVSTSGPRSKSAIAVQQPAKSRSGTAVEAKAEWRRMSKGSPHDEYMRRTFADIVTVVSFLRWALHPTLVAWIDWGSVRLKSGAQVTDTLDVRHADLVFEFAFIGGLGTGRILFEHQRRADPTMLVRTIGYDGGMLGEWASEHPDAECYPEVVNLVLFTGRNGERWKAPADSANPKLPATLRPAMEIPMGVGRYTLVDIAHMAPADILELPICDRAKVALVLVRRAVAKVNLEERIQMLMPYLLRVCEQQDGQAALNATVAYMAKVWAIRQTRLEVLFAPLGVAGKVAIMTLADELEAKGKAEALIQLIELKFSSVPSLVVALIRSTGDVGQLSAWFAAVYAADDLDEVFAA